MAVIVRLLPTSISAPFTSRNVCDTSNVSGEVKIRAWFCEFMALVWSKLKIDCTKVVHDTLCHQIILLYIPQNHHSQSDPLVPAITLPSHWNMIYIRRSFCSTTSSGFSLFHHPKIHKMRFVIISSCSITEDAHLLAVSTQRSPWSKNIHQIN